MITSMKVTLHKSDGQIDIDKNLELLQFNFKEKDYYFELLTNIDARLSVNLAFKFR